MAYIDSMKPRAPPAKVTSCGCLVHKNGAQGPMVLLVRPRAARDMWGVPKGHLEPGETHVACALRETLEETGLVVELEDELPVTYRSSAAEDKTVVTFLARTVDPDAIAHPADGENADVRWFLIDSLPPVHAYQVSVVAAGVELVRARAAV